MKNDEILVLQTGIPRPNYLEGMRGLAAWIVVFGHCVNAFVPTLAGISSVRSFYTPAERTIALTPLNLFFQSHFAVIFFFAHSGFVLSYGFLTKGRRTAILTSSSLRRYPRLALPAAGSVFIGFLLLTLGCFQTQQLAAVTGSRWVAAHFNFRPSFLEALNQGFFSTYIDAPDKPMGIYNSSLWTISVEMAGSFYVFAFLALFGSASKRWIFYLTAVGLTWRSDFLPFFIGMVLCEIWVSRQAWISKRSPLFAPLLLFLGVLLCGWSIEGTKGFYAWTIAFAKTDGDGDRLRTLAAVCFITAPWFSPSLKAVFESAALQKLGRISYSVYLIHLSVLCSAGAAIYLTAQHLGTGDAASALAATVAVVLITFAIACYYRSLVDEPSIRLSHIFERWAAGR